jgi:hypothetical protein
MLLHDLPREKLAHPRLPEDWYKSLAAFIYDRRHREESKIMRITMRGNSVDRLEYWWGQWLPFPNTSHYGWEQEYEAARSRGHAPELDWNRIEVIYL